MSAQLLAQRIEIEYPESDGKPMADNTKQFRYIVTIQGGLDSLFINDPNVLVVGDLFWYPVEGEPWTVVAPDVMIIFGRPKGDRRSYLQWKEGNVAPLVAWEILSPNNTALEMSRKFLFYQKYGVEEYYVYDPDGGTIEGFLREGDYLRGIPKMQGWISPRLKVRFELDGDHLALYAPDGQRFETFVEQAQRVKDAQRQAEQAQRQAEQAQRQAEQSQRLTEQAHLRADQAENDKSAMARELAEVKGRLEAFSRPQA